MGNTLQPRRRNCVVFQTAKTLGDYFKKMAKYTPRAPGRKFSEEEKQSLDGLWDTEELRGVGKYYTPVIERGAAHIARTPKEIKII